MGCKLQVTWHMTAEQAELSSQSTCDSHCGMAVCCQQHLIARKEAVNFHGASTCTFNRCAPGSCIQAVTSSNIVISQVNDSDELCALHWDTHTGAGMPGIHCLPCCYNISSTSLMLRLCPASQMSSQAPHHEASAQLSFAKSGSKTARVPANKIHR